jgi:GNAT superfamily N-acetyltransferase
MRIRTARRNEAQALHELSLRSKAAWGYDEEFMQLASPKLAVRRDWIDADRVWVAERGQSSPNQAGWVVCGLLVILPPHDCGLAEVEHLFVEPTEMKRGVGRALMQQAIAVAAGEGASGIRVLSDPNARGFYERLGFRWLEDAPSDAIPGRTLPLLVRRLRSTDGQ